MISPSPALLPECVIVFGGGSLGAAVAKTLRALLAGSRVSRCESLAEVERAAFVPESVITGCVLYLRGRSDGNVVIDVAHLMEKLRDGVGWTGGLVVCPANERERQKLEAFQLFSGTSGHAALERGFDLPGLLRALADVGEMSVGRWKELKKRADQPRLYGPLESLLADPEAARLHEVLDVVRARRQELAVWTSDHGSGPVSRIVRRLEDCLPGQVQMNPELARDLRDLRSILEPFKEGW